MTAFRNWEAKKGNTRGGGSIPINFTKLRFGIRKGETLHLERQGLEGFFLCCVGKNNPAIRTHPPPLLFNLKPSLLLLLFRRRNNKNQLQRRGCLANLCPPPLLRTVRPDYSLYSRVRKQTFFLRSSSHRFPPKLRHEKEEENCAPHSLRSRGFFFFPGRCMSVGYFSRSDRHCVL